MKFFQAILLFIFIIFALFFGLLLLFKIGKSTTEKSVIIFEGEKNESFEEGPLILLCTDFHERKLIDDNIRNAIKYCPFKCRLSDDFNLYPFADVAIFHARNIVMNDLFYQNKNPSRLNVFFSMESHPHERIRKKQIPKKFFNLTMTFRRDSNFWKPYDKFEETLSHEKENLTLFWGEKEIEKKLSKKTKLALQFVSHCETHSLREKYTEKMEKYANISNYGVCYQKHIKYENESKLIDEHFFYLAFENTVCKDYVTEKFWRLKQLIVPVVLRRSILKGIIEDEYFIAADDFDSPKDLVEKLIYLSKNISEYKKYLRWTKKYKKTSAYNENEYCKLCEMATKKEKHQIENIHEWWEKGAHCTFNYLNHTLEEEAFLKTNKKTNE